MRRGGRLKRQRQAGWQPRVHPRVEGESLYVHDKGPGENAAFMRCQSDCCQGDRDKGPIHFHKAEGCVVRSTSLISVARTWHVGARKGRGVRGALRVTHVDGRPRHTAVLGLHAGTDAVHETMLDTRTHTHAGKPQEQTGVPTESTQDKGRGTAS